ncbi:MAG: hypothetical protein K2I56_06500 [Muribaculaceae bacterium]|nr:hypothetical protein [Muribaculaceae bacterium]
MKRLITYIIAATAALMLHAQSTGDNIRFSLHGVAGEEVTEATATALDTKLRQALNRTGALLDSPDGIFAVRPTLSFATDDGTEGMVMDLSRVKGDLVLEAFNAIDGKVFHSVTVPVSATVTGSRDQALKKLATSIKATDPVFVRFVRKSREKITDYYAENCGIILQRAQTLADTGHDAEALAALAAIAPEMECYDLARQLIAQIDGSPVIPDTVVIENTVQVPVEVPVFIVVEAEPQPVATPSPAPAPAPEPAPEPAPVAPSYTIKLSHPDDFDFRIISCKGIRSGNQIKLTGEFINKKCRYDVQYMALKKGFDQDGNEFPRDNMHIRDYLVENINTPVSVPVKIPFTIYKADPAAVDSLSYLYIEFDRYNIEIRNLPIAWE